MGQRDDRVLVDQWVALVVVLVLLPALVILWGIPFDSDNWMTYAYVIGLGMGAVSLAALYLAMERSGSSRA
ncbi:hypothetical protein BH20ACT17_BH20ACT17_09230 [soil metagenome]